jgi:hypothetical protein
VYGRYARGSDKQKIAELFAIHGPVLPGFGPSGNVGTRDRQRIRLALLKHGRYTKQAKQ